MINIYSIKEIIEASNNILDRKKDKIYNEKIKKKNQEFLIKKKIDNTPLLLTEEVKINSKINIVKKKKIYKTNKNNNKNEILDLNRNFSILKEPNIIDIIYNKFEKKIKKNTIKIIFDLEMEVNNLKKKNNILNNANKQLKIEKNIFYNKIEILNSQKEKINNDNNLLKDDINYKLFELIEIKEEVVNLKKDKINLQNEIQKYINENESYKKKIYDISEVESKNKFFQEENLRIGSELLEIKKKHDILKKEIQKYENQKSNLISKINSVNDALKDTNILTNVFENKIQSKVQIIDHSKIERESLDLDEQIKNIFKDKS